MKLIKVGDCYFSPGKIEAVMPGADGHSMITTAGGHYTAISMTPAEVAAEIERQTREGRAEQFDLDFGRVVALKSGCTITAADPTPAPSSYPLIAGQLWASRERPSEVVEIVEVLSDGGVASRPLANPSGTEYLYPDEFREYYPDRVHPIPERHTGEAAEEVEAASEVPLAVGQVWENTALGGLKSDIRVRIDFINEAVDQIAYSDVSSNCTSTRNTSSFRERFPDLVTLAPGKTVTKSPPSDAEIVAMLADGKRLRFVREDGVLGRLGKCVAVVMTDRLQFDGLRYWRADIEPDHDRNGSVYTVGYTGKEAGARNAVEWLASLGYRYAETVNS